MAQIFHRSSNVIAKASILGVLLVGGLVVNGFMAYVRSDFFTEVGDAKAQPVPFSHQHHVAGLGIDCRYCHTSVENAAYAGIPPTATCMNCHKQIWTNAQLLEPIRASYRTNQPVVWQRVNNVASFVQFNHSIHINKGIGCASCHAGIEKMQLTAKSAPMDMQFCLNCHRAPEKFVRPKSEVFNMEWKAENQAELGAQLVKDYHIRKVTNCSACHY
jgi:hypothetical protein